METKQVWENVLDGVGNTPLVELQRVVPEGLRARRVHVYAKVEMLNPTGSVKDRAARQIVLDALADGRLARGTGQRIIEATSGNMGISLAMIGGVLGIPVTIVMPSSFSRERRLLMARYGAELVLTEPAGGMPGAIARADAMCAADPRAFFKADQFANPSNARAHERTTGPEIRAALAGRGGVSVFVAGAGTGGTVTGVARALRAHADTAPARVVAVEPDESPALSVARAGGAPAPHPHKIQGIGAGFVPRVLDMALLDAVQRVPGDAAVAMAARLAAEEGLSVGISSGAAVAGAIAYTEQHLDDLLAAHPDPNTPINVVVILPDSGDRYLSCE